jgi:hypothetical protein
MTMAAIDFQTLANAGFPPASYEAGEIIFSAGDKGDNMYVIRSGEVEVERDGKIVETLSAGAKWLSSTGRRAQPRRGPRRRARSLPSPSGAFYFWYTRRRFSPSR